MEVTEVSLKLEGSQGGECQQTFEILPQDSLIRAGSIEPVNGIVIGVAEDGSTIQYTQFVQLTDNSSGVAHVLQIDDKDNHEQKAGVDETEDDASGNLIDLLSQAPGSNTPIDAPEWALIMNNCKLIGDSYCGWVSSETELELLLTYHRQMTHSFWGTRQSHGTPRNSLRLMWKSLYVPFDGIPFINADPRAIVMECKYGPRRKGSVKKNKSSQGSMEFTQTCPARIYIKRVRKYPEYKINLHQDKRNLRNDMEKAFVELRKCLESNDSEDKGELRWYVHLPIESAHEFHVGPPSKKLITETSHKAEEIQKEDHVLGQEKNTSRIHPVLVSKIRDLVSNEITDVVQIRKHLRHYVEKEMFTSSEKLPEKRNLYYFPTVHDIKNHVFEALKDIQTGILPLMAPSLSFELKSSDFKAPKSSEKKQPLSSEKVNTQEELLTDVETITVTLARSNNPDEAPIITKVEAVDSDGKSQVTHFLTPETVELLSRFSPIIFPPNTTNIQALKQDTSFEKS